MRAVQQHAPAKTPASSSPSPNRALQRKCARAEPQLAVNAPGDRFEQEADRMAEFVVSGRGGPTRPHSFSSVSLGAVQREEKPAAPKPNNYDEAAKKIAEALAETAIAKELKEKAAAMGKDFLGSIEGKVIAGSALGGALAAIIATNSELPAQLPELPLDFIAPGLKAELVWEGPVQKPTNVSLKLTSKSGVSVAASYSNKPAEGAKPAEQKAGLTLTIPLGGSAEKKAGGPTESEKYRAETARLAAEQAKFREGLKTPAERAEDKAVLDAYMRSKFSDPLNPLGLPSLKKKEDSLLMRKESNESCQSMAAPPIVHDVLAESGQALEAQTRDFMEARFGHDFSRVRVHTDARASDSARSVNAHAYTVGDDIVFDAGRFAPGTTEGRRLLAHELTHVVQQSGELKAGEAEPPSAEADTAPVDGPQAVPDSPAPERMNDTPAQGRAIAVTNGWSNPAGQNDRTTVGIGELSSFVVSDVAGGSWKSADGKGKTMNSVSFQWTASTAGKNTITYTAADKTTSTVTMTTEVPSKLSGKKDRDLPFAAGSQGAGMDLTITVHPTTVSFQALEVMEGTCPASAINGYFSTHAPGPHDAAAGAGTWNQVGSDNDLTDTAHSDGWPAPWTKGSFTWAIPANWRLTGAKTSTAFTATNDQVVNITGTDGTTVVSKLGATTTPRKP